MGQISSAKLIDLTPYLRRARRRELARLLLVLWTQYLSLGVLVLYGLLRALSCPDVPPGAYCGPLALLWPASFLLLLVSCGADRALKTGCKQVYNLPLYKNKKILYVH